MAGSPTTKSLGPVLVVGGCGFLGFHIVRLLLNNPECSSVSVLSRNPTCNRLPGVSYHAGDITNSETVRSLLAELKPRTIIHCASLPGRTDPTQASLCYKINVDGTANLLSCAAQAPSVIAFVYTSSNGVLAGFEHVLADERCPVLTASSEANIYAKSKAIADALVLAANNPKGENGTALRTLCIRPPAMYGERDMQMIHGALEQLKKGVTRVQIGDNSNLCDYLYVENAASAHILAAKALLSDTVDTAQKVDGEAFFITDEAPVLFWDFIRKIWTAAGDQTPLSEVWVIPPRVAMGLASTLEWVYRLASFGQKQPEVFNRQMVQYCCFPRTYCIDKAKERLKYRPYTNIDDGIKKGVQWARKEMAEGS